MPRLEDKFLACLALSDGYRRFVELAFALERRRIDWHRLVRKCLNQNIAPIAYHNLKKAVDEGLVLDAAHLAALKDAHYFTLSKNIGLFTALAAVLEKLDAAGVQAVLLKGADLAVSVYPSMALRGLRDIDLLIRKEQIAAAVEQMERLGYRIIQGVYSVDDEVNESDGCEWALEKDGCVIELHWTIVDSFMPFPVAPADLWRDLRPVTAAGVESAGLAPEALLLHLALHQYKHGWPDLRGVADVHEVVGVFGPTIDWSRLQSLAGRARADRVVYQTLITCRELFDTDIPRAFLVELKRRSAAGFVWHAGFKTLHAAVPPGRLGKVKQRLARRAA